MEPSAWGPYTFGHCRGEGLISRHNDNRTDSLRLSELLWGLVSIFFRDQRRSGAFRLIWPETGKHILRRTPKKERKGERQVCIVIFA